jgi:hypothetical protein
VGHPGVSRLQLAHAVHDGELVLEGVEDADASHLGSAVRAAVGAANAGMKRAERPARPCNVDQSEADRIAAALGLADDRDATPLEAPDPPPEPAPAAPLIPPGG